MSNPNVPTPQGLPEARISLRGKSLLLAILLVTLVSTVAWSRAKIFWVDELLEYYSDTKPHAATIIQDQLHSPFSLEPPAFHLMLHVMHGLLPHSPELAARLPSIAALLVTEFAVFLLSWSLTRSEWAALLAAVFPFFMVTVDYGPEARVYSCLTACFGIALLCYHLATASDSSTRSRTLGVVGLAGSLGFANLLHYYALFLALPFFLAEAYRLLRRRKVDWRLALALSFSTALFLVDLPFMKALHEFSEHYYNTGETQWTAVFFTYIWIFGHFGAYQLPLILPSPDIFLMGLLVVTAMVVILTAYHGFLKLRTMQDDDRSFVFVAILFGFLLPFWNVAIGQLITHAYVPRYSLASCSAIAVLVPFLLPRRDRLLMWLTTAAFALSCVYVIRHVRLAQQQSNIILADTTLTPRLSEILAAEPDHHLYLQDSARFLVSYFYASPQMKQSMVLVYDREKELQLMRRDPSSLFARNLQRTTSLPIRPFRDIIEEPEHHVFAVFHDPREEWIDLDLASRAYRTNMVGHEFGSDLYDVAVLPSH